MTLFERDDTALLDLDDPKSWDHIRDADLVGLVDTPTSVTTYLRTVTDSLGLLDDNSHFAVGPLHTDTITDPTGLTDPKSWDHIRDSDALGITDDISVVHTVPLLTRTETDPFGLTDDMSFVLTATVVLTDPFFIGHGQTKVASFVHLLTDVTGLTDDISSPLLFVRTQTDVIEPTDAATFAKSVLLTVSPDSIGFTDDVSFVLTSPHTQTDPLGISDGISVESASGQSSFEQDDVGLDDDVAWILEAEGWPLQLTDSIEVTFVSGSVDRAELDLVGFGDPDLDWVHEMDRSPLSLTDALTIMFTRGLILVDPLAFTDLTDVTSADAITRSLTDSLDTDDPKSWEHVRDGDAFGITDDVSVLLTQLEPSATSPFDLSDTTDVEIMDVDETIDDAFGLLDDSSSDLDQLEDLFTHVFGLSDQDVVELLDIYETTTNSIGLTDIATAELMAGIIARQRTNLFSLVDSLSFTHTASHTRTVTDNFGLTDTRSFTRLHVRTRTDTLSLIDFTLIPGEELDQPVTNLFSFTDSISTFHSPSFMFEPPSKGGRRWGLHRLMEALGLVPTGITIVIMPDGSVQEVFNVRPIEYLEEAVVVFQGGSVHPITAEQRQILIDAGYGDNIVSG